MYDSTEVAIKKMIDASQKILKVKTKREAMNLAVKKHYERQMETLRKAPRDVNKLEGPLKTKRRQEDEAMHTIEHAQRLV
jgi:hypothetical protein